MPKRTTSDSNSRMSFSTSVKKSYGKSARRKRAPPPFIYFLQAIRPLIKTTYPNRNLFKTASGVWKLMTLEEREPYKQRRKDAMQSLL